MKEKITNFDEKWKSISEIVTKLGLMKGLFVRIKKLNPLLFIKILIKAQIEEQRPSLKDYASKYQEESGQVISPVAIDKKITNSAVDFLKSFLIEIISFTLTKITFTPELIKGFKEVYLLDSTVIELIKELADKYPGSGGSASKSALKIQCLYNVLNIKYEHLEITSGIEPDQKYGSKIIDKLKAGGLILFDLGYVTTAFLTDLILAGIIFLCRFPDYAFKVFNEQGEEINLLSMLKANKDKILDIATFVGPNKIPCRIIAYPLKDTVYNERKEKAIKESKKKGRKPSEKHLEFLKWSIYFTNATFEMLKTKDICIIYRLRWRIELIFKLWKSKLSLEHLSGRRIERIEFELYAKLIALTFFNLFTLPVINILSENFEEKAEISEIVCIKYFKKVLPKIICNLENKSLLKKVLLDYTLLIKQYGLKSKSRKKKSTFDLLNKHAKGGYSIMKINLIDILQAEIQFREINTNKKTCRAKTYP